VDPNEWNGKNFCDVEKENLKNYLWAKIWHDRQCTYNATTRRIDESLSKSVKIKIHRTIFMPVVLYGCETWSFTLKAECRLQVFENRVLRRFGPKRDRWQGNREDYITRSFMLRNPHGISFGWTSQEDWDGQDMWHVGGTGEFHTGSWFEDLREENTGKTQALVEAKYWNGSSRGGMERHGLNWSGSR
jgi:hypothetical protein